MLYYPPKGRPIALGLLSEPAACLAEYGRIVGATGKRPVSLGDVIDKYLLEVVPVTAPRSIEDYRLYCGKLKKAFGHMMPDEIQITDLYDYHNARGAPVRANREITVLGVIYQHAIRWRAATRSPTIGFLFTPEQARDRDVAGWERRRFAKRYCPPWLRAYILLKYLCGRRQGELLKLGLYSVGPAGLTFSILKKRKVRELVIEWTPRLRRVVDFILTQLRRPPAPSGQIISLHDAKEHRRQALFYGERGRPMTKRGFKSAWQRAMAHWQADGYERFWEHDIRAATGTAAASDQRAQELLDHEDVRTTRRSYRRARLQRIKPLK